MCTYVHACTYIRMIMSGEHTCVYFHVQYVHMYLYIYVSICVHTVPSLTHIRMYLFIYIPIYFLGCSRRRRLQNKLWTQNNPLRSTYPVLEEPLTLLCDQQFTRRKKKKLEYAKVSHFCVYRSLVMQCYHSCVNNGVLLLVQLASVSHAVNLLVQLSSVSPAVTLLVQLALYWLLF